jgi:hypothetical protein
LNGSKSQDRTQSREAPMDQQGMPVRRTRESVNSSRGPAAVHPISCHLCPVICLMNFHQPAAVSRLHSSLARPVIHLPCPHKMGAIAPASQPRSGDQPRVCCGLGAEPLARSSPDWLAGAEDGELARLLLHSAEASVPLPRSSERRGGIGIH